MDYLKKPVVLTIIASILVAGAVGAVYFFYGRPQAPKGAQDSQVANKEQVKKLVAEVGKLIDLPTGEDPIIATVTDISKLKDQPFFQKAKNGDKVLIYNNSKKAILYDPFLKKVLDVAPINIGSQSAQVASPTSLSSPKSTPKATPKVTPEVTPE